MPHGMATLILVDRMNWLKSFGILLVLLAAFFIFFVFRLLARVITVVVHDIPGTATKSHVCCVAGLCIDGLLLRCATSSG